MESDIALTRRHNMVQIIIYTLLISFIAISIHYYLVNRQLKSEIAQIEDELKIIVNENIRHRLLAPPYSYTKNICFQINKLCTNYQNDILSLKTSEKKYKDLMINLSHDVRTPLASMLGHLELLTESINESPSDNLSISLEVINRKALELTDFVEMLFQWTKLDANEEKFVFSSYDINEQSRMLISKWISFFDKNNIEYSFHIPEKEYRCSIDAAAYQRILDNLFKNILNHSHATKMKFSVTQSDSHIHLLIEDNGIGIKPEDQNLVFERLYQCDLSRNSKGNGLGLAIVKELVQKMNGTITFKSVPHIYTRFLISFPLQSL